MKQQVIVIVGPTGVGKTACSIQLAKQYHGEIISGDSMQVYKELTIGTAKITPDEMESIPHHLINKLSFTDEYNVKIFQSYGRDCIQDIIKHKQIPIVCGGTGLYIKSLLYDYVFLDQPKDEEFNTFLEKRSNDQLHALLTHIDPKALDKIHKNNRQRLIRALEMAHLGETKSAINEKQDHTLLYDVFCIGLTCDREILYERINTRVDNMMDQGLFHEIEGLYKQYGDDLWGLQSMQSIGYKEWRPYFHQECDIATCVEAIKKNSRNFAKRQYTWFYNQMDVHWYDIFHANYQEDLETDLKNWLKVA